MSTDRFQIELNQDTEYEDFDPKRLPVSKTFSFRLLDNGVEVLALHAIGRVEVNYPGPQSLAELVELANEAHRSRTSGGPS